MRPSIIPSVVKDLLVTFHHKIPHLPERKEPMRLIVAGNVVSDIHQQIAELLQIVENGGLTTAVFYICSSVSVCG